MTPVQFRLRLWLADLAWLSITMCCVQLKHVSAFGSGGWVPGFLGACSFYFSFQGRQLPLTHSGTGGLWPGHC